MRCIGGGLDGMGGISGISDYGEKKKQSRLIELHENENIILNVGLRTLLLIIKFKKSYKTCKHNSIIYISKTLLYQ